MTTARSHVIDLIQGLIHLDGCVGISSEQRFDAVGQVVDALLDAAVERLRDERRKEREAHPLTSVTVGNSGVALPGVCTPQCAAVRADVFFRERPSPAWGLCVFHQGALPEAKHGTGEPR